MSVRTDHDEHSLLPVDAGAADAIGTEGVARSPPRSAAPTAVFWISP